MLDALQKRGSRMSVRYASLYCTLMVLIALLVYLIHRWQVYIFWQYALKRVILTSLLHLWNLRASMLHLIESARLSRSMSHSSLRSSVKIWPRYLNRCTTRTGVPFRTTSGTLSGPLPALNTNISVLDTLYFSP
ncbi:hypothetical protein JYU34_017029 [Plutella xylostella]|uniref:Uncharacterized protein n=1 Tax=Plutella xylostella TaxID=51655 RepID=A0ABQ7Q424_PLUXY|nr:hypothetical protein JYU34_017029 [Plutella xylostella]